MSTDRDVTRTVRSWLEEGVTSLPDRVLDNVLDQLPATPQRRPWWPARRFGEMNTVTKFAVAAAAVVAVAIVGINVLPRPGGVGGPSPSPTPLITPGPPPSPLPSTGALAPGTYYIDAGSLIPARMTFTVPAGWVADSGFVYNDPAVAAAPSPDVSKARLMLVTWIVSHVYTDACHWQGKLTPAGTADQLTALLQNQKGRTASAPIDVVLGGAAAKRIVMTVPADLDVATCDPGLNGAGIIRFWPDPGPDESGGLCCSAVGSTDVVYVLNGAGKTYTIVARHQADSSSQEIAALDGIVASIRLDPATSGPSPSMPSPSP